MFGDYHHEQEQSYSTCSRQQPYHLSSLFAEYNQLILVSLLNQALIPDVHVEE